jgi:hypothetical protein
VRGPYFSSARSKMASLHVNMRPLSPPTAYPHVTRDVPTQQEQRPYSLVTVRIFKSNGLPIGYLYREKVWIHPTSANISTCTRGDGQ